MKLNSKMWYLPLMLLLTQNVILAMRSSALATLGAATAGYFIDRSDTREIIDVASPSQKRIIELNKVYKGIPIVNSVTKHQINYDPLLSLATIDDASSLTKKQINRLSLWENWVFMPKMRQQLNHLTEYICHEEQVYKEQDYFCCVHGTNNGAAMLLRTIVGEVLHDEPPKKQWMQMRSVEEAKKRIQHKDAQEYYDDCYKKAPRMKEMVSGLGNSVPTGNELVYMDLSDNRKELLSVNLGLYGNNSWITGPRKESSIEFIARPCSWATQALDVSLSSLGLIMKQPAVMKKIMSRVFQNSSHISYLPMIVDTTAKDVDSKIIQGLFQEYGVEHLYEKYEKELREYEMQASAGLLQLMIPAKKAERWCYVSKMLGIKAADYSVMKLQEEKKRLLPGQQARIVLHPDIIAYNAEDKKNNMIMHCYLLIDPKKLSHMTKRMYEIAKEMKEARK